MVYVCSDSFEISIFSSFDIFQTLSAFQFFSYAYLLFEIFELNLYLLNELVYVWCILHSNIFINYLYDCNISNDQVFSNNYRFFLKVVNIFSGYSSGFLKNIYSDNKISYFRWAISQFLDSEKSNNG